MNLYKKCTAKPNSFFVTDTTFKTMNLYKKCTAKPYSFFVIDTTYASDSSSHFRKNLLERIKDEKLQYIINREAAKISVLSSGKINKYEYFTVEELLLFNQSLHILLSVKHLKNK